VLRVRPRCVLALSVPLIETPVRWRRHPGAGRRMGEKKQRTP